MSERDSLACPIGGCPVERHFAPESIPFGRIDAAGDDVQSERRQSDGSAGWNLGLPPIATGAKSVGRNGKPRDDFRPRTNREVSSNANAKEIAKSHGLSPVESGGVYRTTPR